MKIGRALYARDEAPPTHAGEETSSDDEAALAQAQARLRWEWGEVGMPAIKALLLNVASSHRRATAELNEKLVEERMGVTAALVDAQRSPEGRAALVVRIPVGACAAAAAAAASSATAGQAIADGGSDGDGDDCPRPVSGISAFACFWEAAARSAPPRRDARRDESAFRREVRAWLPACLPLAVGPIPTVFIDPHPPSIARHMSTPPHY
jgi:hypothetical protein